MNNDSTQKPPDLKEPNRQSEVSGVLNGVKDKLIYIQSKESKYMDSLKLRHKITFAFLVFFAINLLWYGMWEIVSTLPILSNPYLALIIGGIILIGTGYFYENLISVNFNKRTRKKKNPETNDPPPPSSETKGN